MDHGFSWTTRQRHLRGIKPAPDDPVLETTAPDFLALSDSGLRCNLMTVRLNTATDRVVGLNEASNE